VTESLRAKHVRKLCQELGVNIEPRGVAWLLRGPGVNLLVADLAVITRDDLLPKREDGFLATPKHRMTAKHRNAVKGSRAP